MDKQTVNRHTAEYVVEHGKKQKRRGRNPSMSFLIYKNPLIALKMAQLALEDKGYDPIKNTLLGNPFVGEINDWAKKYQEHLASPNAHISFSPKEGIDKRDCGYCFFRYGCPTEDCSIADNSAKKKFGVSSKSFMPTEMNGKNVAHFCPHFLEPWAE